MDNQVNASGTSGKGILQNALVSKLAAAFLLVATVLVGAQAIKALNNLDTPPPLSGNTISVEGTGKVAAVPDIATVSYTISESATTVAEAQDAATKKSNVALALIKDLGIDDKDIKTTSYNVSPQYSYQGPCYSGLCPPYESRITGYTVSQTVDVKIRDLDQTGGVLAALGDSGVSNLYGPNFVIDDEDELRAEARAEAIREARAKAKILAKNLNVRLVRVVSFFENSGPVYPYPYGIRSEAFGMGGDSIAAKAPDVPAGENEIAVSVSITYEIR